MTTSSGPAKLTLPTATQILIEREFDAPPDLVYRAWTTPELVARWWHANRGEVTLVEIDLRVGGAWRQVMIAAGGVEVGFHGEYLEIVPGKRLVYTEVFEGMPGEPAINTLTLSEDGGRTRLSLLTEAGSREARDAIVDSGMEDGLQDALDLLEGVASSLG